MATNQNITELGNPLFPAGIVKKQKIIYHGSLSVTDCWLEQESPKQDQVAEGFKGFKSSTDYYNCISNSLTDKMDKIPYPSSLIQDPGKHSRIRTGKSLILILEVSNSVNAKTQEEYFIATSTPALDGWSDSCKNI